MEQFNFQVSSYIIFNVYLEIFVLNLKIILIFTFQKINSYLQHVIKRILTFIKAWLKNHYIQGEGAYSSVYKVKRLQDNIEYALKKVYLVNLSDKEKENALNEVRILASIRH